MAGKWIGNPETYQILAQLLNYLLQSFVPSHGKWRNWSKEVFSKPQGFFPPYLS